MQTEKNSKPRAQKKTVKKVLAAAVILLVILILPAVFLLPAFVSSEKGRKTILAKINSSIDGRADFVSLSMSWLKGVRIKGISFKDGTGQTSVEVKQIAAMPHYVSILMGSLSFGKTVIDEPRVAINLKAPPSGENKASFQGAPAAPKTKTVVLPLSRIDLVVNNGSLKITDPQARTVELSQINSSVDLRPPGQQTDFDVNMVVADEGKESKVHSDGRIVPQKQTGWSLKGTSGDFIVEVNDLDLESLESVFALAGVDVQAVGKISADIKSKIKDGQIEAINGTVSGENLDLTAGRLKGDRLKSSRLDVAVELQRRGELINIDNLQVHCDWADVNAGGVVPTTFKSLAELAEPDSQYNLRANFGCNLAAVLSQMPATFGLKEGTKMTSGRLNGNVETLNQAGRRKIIGTANLVGLAGTVGEKTIALSESITAEAEITSDKAGINFDKLDVSAPSARINCRGSSKLLKYSANVDLAKLQTELGQFVDTGQYRISGAFVGEGTVSGDKDKISLTGSSSVKNLRLSSQRGPTAEEPMIDMSFSFAVEPAVGVLGVDFIKVGAGFGQLDIKDAVLPLNKESRKPLSLPVSAKIDLQKLRPFMVVLASLPPELQLSGIVESNVSVSTEKDSYRFVIDATKFENLKIGYPQKKPFEQVQILLAADVQLNPVEKTFAVTKLQITSPQIKILRGQVSQAVRGDRSELKGQVDCEYDWAAVSAAAGAFLPGGLELQGQRRDTINFSSQYPVGRTEELLANLDTSGKVGFEKARYMGLNFGPTEIDIQVQKGLLRIAPFSTTVNEGQLNFAGEADFSKKPALLRIPKPIQIAKDIRINNEVAQQLLANLNPIFKDQTNIQGIVSLYCKKMVLPLGGDPVLKPDIAGTVSIDELRLQTTGLLGLIMAKIDAPAQMQGALKPTDFTVQNDVVSYDNMQLVLSEYPMDFAGRIGPQRQLDMTVTTPCLLTPDFKLRPVRVGEPGMDQRVELPLQGTIDHPELNWAKFLEKFMQQQLLQRGLRELLK